MQSKILFLIMILVGGRSIHSQEKLIPLSEVKVCNKILYDVIDKYQHENYEPVDTISKPYLNKVETLIDTSRGLYLITMDKYLKKVCFMICEVEKIQLRTLDKFKYNYTRYFYYAGALVLINNNIGNKYVKRTGAKKKFDFIYINPREEKRKVASIVDDIPDYLEPIAFQYCVEDNKVKYYSNGRIGID